MNEMKRNRLIKINYRCLIVLVLIVSDAIPKVKGEFICVISQSKHVEQTQTVGLIFHFAPLFIRTKRHNQQNRNLQLVNVL